MVSALCWICDVLFGQTCVYGRLVLGHSFRSCSVTFFTCATIRIVHHIQVIQLQRGLKHMHEVAKARLHLACALSHSRQHKKAIMCLGKVVEMVERGELEGGGSSAEKLCLVAVCYHNIAVEQLILKRLS